ncbi:MAG: PstA family ABC transporter permease [Streptosporangiaceae bacterium]
MAVAAAPRPPEVRVHMASVSADGAATIGGAGLAALALTWVLFERVLPFTGVLGFWVIWYLVFLVFYGFMATMQWDRLEATNRVTAIGFGTGGALALAIVVAIVAYTLAKGVDAVTHISFITTSMADSGPALPLAVGGCLHAIVGTVEQIGLATIFSVPLGVAAALFLAEVGGPLARPVRTIVEAMTALPDLIAGLFIYVLFILTLHFVKSGLMAALALSVTMMPIITRASEVVIRLVPGTLREASLALGASQWRTAWNVVLPTARSGLATAVVLAMARGIGETAAVLFTAGFTKSTNFNPISGPQINLPLFIWNYAHNEAQIPADLARGFGGGFVLVVLVVGLFTLARIIGGAAPGEMSRSQRRKIARVTARAGTS